MIETLALVKTVGNDSRGGDGDSLIFPESVRQYPEQVSLQHAGISVERNTLAGVPAIATSTGRSRQTCSNGTNVYEVGLGAGWAC